MKLEVFSQLSDAQQQGVLIIDSGLGALSLMNSVQKLLPEISITAVADNQAFPYGSKSAESLIERVLHLAEFFIHRTNPSTLLIACNTASTLVLPHLREKYNIPIVGVVPAIKPAASLSVTKKIALLATSATVQRDYVDNLISEYAKDCEVIRISCPALASLAEKKMFGQSYSGSELSDQLGPLIQHRKFDEIDTLILGCTHFGILRKEIAEIIKRPVHILDPADAVAKQVKRVYSVNGSSGVCRLIFTAFPKKLKKKNFLGINDIFYL